MPESSSKLGFAELSTRGKIPGISERAGLKSGRGVALSFGLDPDEFGEFFTPLSKDIFDLLKPEAFEPERQFRTDIFRENTLSDFLRSRETLSSKIGRSGLASSRMSSKFGDLSDKYSNVLSSGMFDIEQGIIGKQQDAQRAFQTWLDGIRQQALQIQQA